MSEHVVGVEPTLYNGKKYRSTLEANTAETLDKMGIPWEYEIRTFVLQESFYSQYQKRKVKRIEYTPDFFIGPIMVEMKGYETPEWKIKKKLFFKYLKENEPDAIWYMCKNTKQLLEVLDRHWSYLGYSIQVTSKGSAKNPSEIKIFDSIQQAISELKLKGNALTQILRVLTGKKELAYQYKWKLIKN